MSLLLVCLSNATPLNENLASFSDKINFCSIFNPNSFTSGPVASVGWRESFYECLTQQLKRWREIGKGCLSVSLSERRTIAM